MSKLWSPHSLHNDLFVWLDGKDTSGFGTVPTDGTLVDVWQDKSRNRLKFNAGSVNNREGTINNSPDGYTNATTVDINNVVIAGTSTAVTGFTVGHRLIGTGVDGIVLITGRSNVATGSVTVTLDNPITLAHGAAVAHQFGLPSYSTSLNAVEFNSKQLLDAVRGTAIDDFPTSAFHVFVVGRIDSGSGGDSDDVLISADSTGSTEGELLFFKDSGSALQASITGIDDGGSTQTVTHGTTVAYGTVGIFESFYDASGGSNNLGVNINGGTPATNTLTLDINASSTIRLMATNNFDGTDGHLKEVLIFKRKLTDAETAIVQGYLAHKYEITSVLASDHAYKTAAPLQTTLFNDAHKLNPREPIQVVKMYLDECDNIYGVTSDLSTCSIENPVNANACHNTKHTCVNLTKYRLNNVGVKELVFSSEKAKHYLVESFLLILH